MMVVSEEPKLIVSDINIIYKPKPKRAYKSNSKSSPFSHFNRKDFRKEKKQKHKLKKKKENWNLNLDKNGISKSQNFESISIEEIENSTQLDILEFYNVDCNIKNKITLGELCKYFEGKKKS